jgi:hypothetical protein
VTLRGGRLRVIPVLLEPVPPRLARNTIIESTFDVGRRFRCTMRVDCGELDPGAVIQAIPGEWHPRMPEQLNKEELADWRAGAMRSISCRAHHRRPARGRRRVSVSNQGAWGPQSTAAKLKTPAGEAGAFGGRAWGES